MTNRHERDSSHIVCHVNGHKVNDCVAGVAEDMHLSATSDAKTSGMTAMYLGAQCEPPRISV